jgi:hypothetical protein
MSKAMHEQRRLMGLEPRFGWTVNEGKGEGRPTHPDSPETDQNLASTPKPDDQEPPNVAGAGASKHWDMYRGLEEKAKEMAENVIEMWEQMNLVTEDEMSRESRRAIKAAKIAVREAVATQKVAYRKISEFGSALLGK